MYSKTIKQVHNVGGFGDSSTTPEQYAAGVLRGSNDWDEMVASQRSEWQQDYLNRKIPETSLIELLDPKGSKPEVKENKTVGKTAEVANCDFFAVHGHWSLTTLKYKASRVKNDPSRQKYDFSFQYRLGSFGTPFPFRARQVIVHNHGEDIYQEWKQLVMAGWTESSEWLVDQLRAHHPGFKAWSVLCSESSERLMKTCPVVCVRSGIAFMSL